MSTKTGFKAAKQTLDNLITSFEGYVVKFPGANFEDTVAVLKKERAELVNKIGKFKLKEEEIISEDLMTPVFVGDDISVNAALQSWTSLMSVFMSVEQGVQDNANKLAIMNAMSMILSSKVTALMQPAQASMAAVTAGTSATPTVDPLVLTPMPDATPIATTSDIPPPVVEPGMAAPMELPPPEDCAVEDEEEVESDEFKGGQEESPSTEIPMTDTVETGDAIEAANNDADPDKKAVVDLTIEAQDIVEHGKIKSFKQWAGLEHNKMADIVANLTNEDLVLISKNNEACVTGDALLQLHLVKKEMAKRSVAKAVSNPELSEATKRMMQIAGLR